MRNNLPILLLLSVSATVASAGVVTIDNTKPRLTSTGEILDGHDGRIQKFTSNGPYYLHSLAYGDCHEPDGYGCNQTPDHCGFHLDHNISVYTSPDLSSGSWNYVGNAIDVTARPAGTVFRPDVVFNQNTNEYVMWWNWVAANGSYMGYATSTSPQPEGPFTLVQDVVQLTHSNSTYHAGDWHFFIDDDDAHTGYVIYCAEFYCWIDQLTPDYLSSTGNFAGPIGNLYFVEAPALFKRSGVYYALFDHCCCFCFQGSGIKVFTASSPLGPWTQQPDLDDMACVPPEQIELGAQGGNAVATTNQVLPGAAVGAAASKISVASAVYGAASTSTGQERAAGMKKSSPSSTNSSSSSSSTSTIVVVEASYGMNCNTSLQGAMTAEVGNYCGGATDCNYQVCICGQNACEQGAPKCVSDPDLGCAKDFRVTWTCTGDSPPVNYTFTVPSEADDASVPLSCSGVTRPYVLPTPGQGCLYQATNVSNTRSQQSGIASIDTPDGTLLLWIGDRWQQAPDGIKGHEPQFWVPLEFDDSFAISRVKEVVWVDNFTMTVV